MTVTTNKYIGRNMAAKREYDKVYSLARRRGIVFTKANMFKVMNPSGWGGCYAFDFESSQWIGDHNGMLTTNEMYSLLEKLPTATVTPSKDRVNKVRVMIYPEGNTPWVNRERSKNRPLKIVNIDKWLKYIFNSVAYMENSTNYTYGSLELAEIPTEDELLYLVGNGVDQPSAECYIPESYFNTNAVEAYLKEGDVFEGLDDDD